MNTPKSLNAASAKLHAGELTRICAQGGISSAAARAMVGRGSPEDLVKVTQALLDAGKLPPPDSAHPTPETRIRGMQWEWGIGVDCAGYTQLAAAEAHGVAGEVFKTNLMGDMFTAMQHDMRFCAVAIADIRPGDVLHLDAPNRGEVGHNVICYAHRVLGAADREALLRSRRTGERGAEFLRSNGPFHVFDVDSSWGAGDGSMVGGFRRDTWLFDESTSRWASYPSGNRALALDVHPSGPQAEIFVGAFRPKAAR